MPTTWRYIFARSTHISGAPNNTLHFTWRWCRGSTSNRCTWLATTLAWRGTCCNASRPGRVSRIGQHWRTYFCMFWSWFTCIILWWHNGTCCVNSNLRNFVCSLFRYAYRSWLPRWKSVHLRCQLNEAAATTYRVCLLGHQSRNRSGCSDTITRWRPWWLSHNLWSARWNTPGEASSTWRCTDYIAVAWFGAAWTALRLYWRLATYPGFWLTPTSTNITHWPRHPVNLALWRNTCIKCRWHVEAASLLGGTSRDRINRCWCVARCNCTGSTPVYSWQRWGAVCFCTWVKSFRLKIQYM